MVLLVFNFRFSAFSFSFWVLGFRFSALFRPLTRSAQGFSPLTSHLSLKSSHCLNNNGLETAPFGERIRNMLLMVGAIAVASTVESICRGAIS